MNNMTEGLAIVLYVLGAILLVVLIILGIKLIIAMDKIEKVVDNINTKVDSLNGLFSVIDFTTDKLTTISDRVVEGVTSLAHKIFNRKKEEEFDDE